MAKRIHEEDIRVNILIGDNQAQRELRDLDVATKNYIETNKNLRKEKAQLEAAGKKETAEYKRITAEIRQNNAAIKANEERMKSLRGEIGINALTIQQLKKHAKDLRFQLDRMVPGSEPWKKLNAELQQTTARLRELGTAGRAKQSTFSSAANWMNKYQTMILSVAASITGLTYSLQKWLDYSGKLSDANADVMKVTGLTAKQIDELNVELSKINTRTSRVELLSLAEQAGRLGKDSVEDVAGFVEVANRLKVALGDDLNDTQIQEVGKLVTTYRVGEETAKDFNGAMEALGSAINEVSASGSNQAGFLVDYMSRMAGIASQARISSADNLGYAATYDELGQSAEVASTAMNKVVMDMFKNPAEYAKIAGVSIQDFNKLLAEDSNAAMIKFLEGLKGNSAGMQEMLVKMEELDAGGTRGLQALSALANNLDILKSRQETANIAMLEATSLTDEYNIKNNNLAAILDKIKKTTAGWFTSDTLVKWLTESVSWFAKLIGAIEDTDHKGAQWRNNLVLLAKVVSVIVAGLVSYKAALQLVAIWTNRNAAGTALYNAQLKINQALTAISIIKTELYAAAQLLLAGNVKGAIAQVKALNAVLFSSPWGALISLLTAATAAFFLFRDSAEEVNAELEVTKKIQDEVADSTANHKNKIDALQKTLNDENATLEQKQKALKILKSITNGYLDTLTLENIKTNESINLIKSYIKHIDALAKAKAVVALKTELYKEHLKNETKIEALKIEKDATTRTGRGLGSDGKLFGFDIGRNKKMIEDEINKATTQNNQIKQQLDVATKMQETQTDLIRGRIAFNEATLKNLKADSEEAKRLTAMIAGDTKELNALLGIEDEKTTNITEVSTPDLTRTSTAGKTTTQTRASRGKSDAERAREQEKRERDRYYSDLLSQIQKSEEEILAIKREYEDLQIASLDDYFERERATLDMQHQRKIEDLRKQLISEEALKNIDEEKIKATKKGDTELVSALDNMRQTFLIKNAEINDLIAQQQLKYNEDLLKLGREFELKSIDQLTKGADRKVKELGRKQREELAGIESLEDAKEILRRSKSEKELARITTWQEARKALDAQYEKETLQQQEEFLREQLRQMEDILQGGVSSGIHLDLLTDEQKEEFIEKMEVIRDELNELLIIKNNLNGRGTEDSGSSTLNKFNADIFGFSPDDWQLLYEHIEQGRIGFEEVAAAIGLMQNAYAQYAKLVVANENRNLRIFEENTNRKRNALERQLDQGYINQVTYNEEVRKLEDAYNKRKAEIEYKQAKREKQMALVSAIMGTASAITKALPNVILAGIVGALGGLQVAMIAKQPLPTKGYEDGYLDVIREQDGKKFRAKKGGIAKTGLVDRPTHFLAGEQGQHFPEMIIDGPTWKKMDPDLKYALANDIQRVKGYEDGYYPNVASADNGEIKALLTLNYEVLSDIKEKGIDARVISDYRNAAEIDKSLERLKKFKAKRNK
ncbi:phage tail tape measure protein [Weeksella virosa]|uniref:phage tail tape measure protein n=1 Tax=Weeksella virosa TaxID=1014 RepID=UPI00255602E6|nr:phage tail tape measure protein [Weeksella virosa]MDK7375998.1 phage tail tape measure protein [Weeksella virosa]